MKLEEFTKPAGTAVQPAHGGGLAAAVLPPPLHGRESEAAVPAWVLPIEHFSASQLQMLEICPEQYRLRYILGRKEAPGQALLLGKLTHEGIEFGLAEKALTENEPRLEDMLAWYHDAVWPRTVEAYGGEGEIVWDDEPEDVRGKGAAMVSAYHPTIFRLEPERVEEEFLLDLGLQVPVKGFIDVTQKNGRPSLDLKTSSKRRSDLRPDWRVQARVYQLAVPRAVDFHVITKAKFPDVITGLDAEGLIETYSAERAEHMRRRLGQALAAANHYFTVYGPDETWPTRGVHHDWRCKWCAWQPECPEWT